MVYMPHWPSPGVRSDIKLGLSRMHELLTNLGNPHHKLPPVIHIAGTNGKGSSTAYFKAILEHAGLKVHRYTSPHLERFNQRIELAGDEISDGYLYEILEETRVANQGVHATFFESTTAAAFLAFSRVHADVLILEVGMGGRLDATNVIANPALSLITPVGLDHVEFLGGNLALIAHEKAGVIKLHSPCVVSWQHREAMKVITERAEELESPIYAWGEHWNFEVQQDGFVLVDLRANNVVMELPMPGLLGLHQIVNAAAVAAASYRFLQENLPIRTQNIQWGIKHAKWPGRLQHITTGKLANMLPAGYELWMDGAHNPDGAQMLAASMEHLWQDKPTVLINGRTGQRDIASFLEPFKELVQHVYAVTVQSEPNGEKSHNIARVAESMGFNTRDSGDIVSAIKEISSSHGPCRIMVTGSLYLLSDILHC
jgi:dihydrofolate synthase/folylpolyglutamate synthase